MTFIDGQHEPAVANAVDREETLHCDSSRAHLAVCSRASLTASAPLGVGALGAQLNWRALGPIGTL